MFYCGIDVAKRKHAVVMLNERGQTHKPVFTIENTHAGMEFLVEELKRLGEEVLVGLEATGHYWLSLYDVLTRQGYAVAVINPLANRRLSQERRAQGEERSNGCCLDRGFCAHCQFTRLHPGYPHAAATA